jgi:hypothetical protein
MITIFCGFRKFSAKKLAVFSKTNVMIEILHNLPLFLSQKRQFCCKKLRKYFKNHNIDPQVDRGMRDVLQSDELFDCKDAVNRAFHFAKKASTGEDKGSISQKSVVGLKTFGPNFCRKILDKVLPYIKQN